MTLQDQLLQKQRELSLLEKINTQRKIEYEEQLIEIQEREVALIQTESKLRKLSDAAREGYGRPTQSRKPLV